PDRAHWTCQYTARAVRSPQEGGRDAKARRGEGVAKEEVLATEDTESTEGRHRVKDRSSWTLGLVLCLILGLGILNPKTRGERQAGMPVLQKRRQSPFPLRGFLRAIAPSRLFPTRSHRRMQRPAHVVGQVVRD